MLPLERFRYLAFVTHSLTSRTGTVMLQMGITSRLKVLSVSSCEQALRGRKGMHLLLSTLGTRTFYLL